MTRRPAPFPVWRTITRRVVCRVRGHQWRRGQRVRMWDSDWNPTGQYLAISCARCGHRTHRARGELAEVNNVGMTYHRVGEW